MTKVEIEPDDHDPVWLILKQLEEMIEFPSRWRIKKANEYADIIFISFTAIKKLGLDPFKIMDERLDNRFVGKFREIIAKYEKIRKDELKGKKDPLGVEK
jgi:hypothetical protein